MSKLFIVPTPVGNLEDITLRALRILKEVSFILAEDTRTTSFLLKHFNIEAKLVSHHKFNEHATVNRVVEQIKAGVKEGSSDITATLFGVSGKKSVTVTA